MAGPRSLGDLFVCCWALAGRVLMDPLHSSLSCQHLGCIPVSYCSYVTSTILMLVRSCAVWNLHKAQPGPLSQFKLSAPLLVCALFHTCIATLGVCWQLNVAGWDGSWNAGYFTQVGVKRAGMRWWNTTTLSYRHGEIYRRDGDTTCITTVHKMRDVRGSESIHWYL